MICDMEWEMMMTVLPRLISSMLALICSVAMASSDAVGSSRKMMGGVYRNMRAIAMRCCWPPLSWVACEANPFGRATTWS